MRMINRDYRGFSFALWMRQMSSFLVTLATFVMQNLKGQAVTMYHDYSDTDEKIFRNFKMQRIYLTPYQSTWKNIKTR